MTFFGLQPCYLEELIPLGPQQSAWYQIPAPGLLSQGFGLIDSEVCEKTNIVKQAREVKNMQGR